MVFDSYNRNREEPYKTPMLVLRYFSMQIFMAALSRVTAVVLLLVSIWCVTAAFACGVPEILSFEIPPMKWKEHNRVFLRIHNE